MISSLLKVSEYQALRDTAHRNSFLHLILYDANPVFIYSVVRIWSYDNAFSSLRHLVKRKTKRFSHSLLYLSVCMLFVCMSICLPLSVCLSTSVCLSVYLCLSVCLSRTHQNHSMYFLNMGYP